MCITETKLGESFLNNQFVLVGYHFPYRLDITDQKRGLMVFVKSHIPSRRLNDFKIPSNIQIIRFKISLRKEKWLVASIYKVPPQENKCFLWYLTNLLEFYSTRYEKGIILSDFSFETGLSDHHHMIYTILKTKFETFEPKKLIYRNFKQFYNEQFKLNTCTSMSVVRTHADFENNFISILDKHAPKKTKTLRGNQKTPF